MTCTFPDYENLYIPSVDDVDDYYSGRKTVVEIQASWSARTVVAVEEDPIAPVCNTPTAVPVIAPVPIARETPYFEKGSKDKLKTVCNADEILVSRDSNDKGAKCYQIVAWNKWIKKTQRYDTHDYECLRGTVYPYMDIESEREGIDVVAMLNHSIGVFIDALQEAGLVVEGVAIANSSRPGKTSFHAVIHTDKVFENTLTLKEFIYTNIKPRFLTGVDDTLLHSIQWTREDKKTNLMQTMDCVDWMVYTTDRVIRFLNQSKIGKKVRLTAYTHDDIVVPCPLLVKPEDFLIGHYGQVECKNIYEVALPIHIQRIKDAKQTQEGTIIPITPFEHFDATYLSELATLVPTEIIASGTTCCKFIWAMARSGASNELIHAHCKRTANYDAEWVAYHIEHATTMNVNIGTLRYWVSKADKDAYHALSKKYQKIELKNEVHSFTSVIPTTQYHERFVKPFNFKGCDTMLLKSHLGTGKTTQLINAIKPTKGFMMPEHTPFKRILIISGRKSFTKFICGDLAEAGLGFSAYDDRHSVPLASLNRLVIQVESLWRLEDSFHKYDLVAVDESETVAHQFYSEATHRQNMIRNHIVFERCISTATKVLFADAFLGSRTIKISEALRNIEHSQIVENTFCPYSRKAIQLGTIRNGKAIPALGEFCNRIMADLKAGQKIAVVWGSKNKAKAFAETFLKNTTYKWRLYSSETTPEHRDELGDVSTHWKSLDLLMYTSTITVGVNYDPECEADQFDKLYLYASASGGLPRDIAQALLRCRKIKSNTLIYTVDNNALQTALYGREAIKVAITDKARNLRLANPVLTWENAPRWAEDVYIENENENGAKCVAFTDVLQGYLEKSGYTLSSEMCKDTDLKLECAKVAYDEIETLDADAVESIQYKSKKGMATIDEKLSLQKYKFVRQFKPGCDDELLSSVWAKYIMDNKDHLFWNQVNEKHQTTADYLAFESEQKYICAASKKCLKRTVIDKLLPVLGIKTTADAFTITITDVIVESLKGLEAEAYQAFQNNGVRRKGDFTASSAVDVVKMMFEGWNGEGVESDRKRKMIKGVNSQIFTITNKPNKLWDLITDRTTVEITEA